MLKNKGANLISSGNRFFQFVQLNGPFKMIRKERGLMTFYVQLKSGLTNIFRLIFNLEIWYSEHCLGRLGLFLSKLTPGEPKEKETILVSSMIATPRSRQTHRKMRTSMVGWERLSLRSCCRALTSSLVRGKVTDPAVFYSRVAGLPTGETMGCRQSNGPSQSP